jgi:eukaryotic-like serine/threonine-protein kinase
MSSETSNPDSSSPTEELNARLEPGAPGAFELLSTPQPEVAPTSVAADQALFALEVRPTTQTPVELDTIGSPLPRAGLLSSRVAGRFPRFLGEYELLEEINHGGMGVVYRARQEKPNRLVAVKVIRSGSLAGADDLRRFRQEAEAMAELDHPHIIPIYQIGEEDDQPYFSMKLIEGGSLTSHIERLKDEPRTVATIIAKVARAVHFAHQRMILHRDLKPSNILLAEHDEPFVTDFGLAKRISPDSGSAATVTFAVMGTPAYMSPEQARGGTKNVTTAADIYSLGATLFQALTGQPPFTGDSALEIMRQVMDQEPTGPRSINPKLDRDLETICLKCLAKEPVGRYGTAEKLAEDLELWLQGMPIKGRPVSARERAVKWVKRRPALATLVVMLPLAVMGLFGGGIWFTLRLQSALDLANRGRYAADMNLARRALDDGSIYHVREQLKLYLTGPRALADLRSFEWYYLANLCDQTPIRLRGHQKAVICVAFHPDGKHVVSGAADGTVRIWDLASGQASRVFPGDGGSVHCVAISPDGRWLAAGDSGFGVRLWELETGRQRSLAAHQSGLRSVAFSADSGHLLSCEAAGLIVQWDVRSGNVDFRLRHRDQDEKLDPIAAGTNGSELRGIIAVYGRPDGKTIISAGQDQWVMIRDVETRRLLSQVQIGTNIFGFSISPDGRELALAEQAPGIEILDLAKPEGRRRAVRSGLSNRIGGVAFSPDGRMLAMGDYGGRTGLLDAKSSQIRDLFEHVNPSPFSLAFAPEGRVLAMAVGHEVHVVRVDRSLSGDTVAEGPEPIRQLAVSADERLLALGRDDGTIVVSDVPSGQILQTLSGHGLAVFGLAFVPRPGGYRLVSVGGDGLIRVWGPEPGAEPLHTMIGGARAVYAVAVRPDGRQIASGGEDGMVRTWDPATGQADLTPLDHGAPVSALAYDPTGTALASGGMDRTVRVWSATSGRQRIGPLSHSHQLTSLAFSPNGRQLAGGGGATDMGGKIQIWDASSGAISAEVLCPRGVDSLSFSFDSRRIATCGSDSVVQVWDATGEHEMLSLDAHRGRVSAVVFARSDLRLYSAARDGVVTRWDGSTRGHQ